MSKIVINADICNGLPTIQGTRITAQTVLEFLSAGDTIEEVLEEYPSLTKDDVLACLAYSVRLIRRLKSSSSSRRLDCGWCFGIVLLSDL
jgi:uncharacterized protein (DUF433 family)